jgi:hypothetical protein
VVDDRQVAGRVAGGDGVRDVRELRRDRRDEHGRDGEEETHRESS